MLTKLKEDYKRLLESKEFKNKGFLCGAFLICDINELERTPWQIDFYNTNNDTITTYLIEKDIGIKENSEVFKKEDMKVEELKLDEIKIDFETLKKKIQYILEMHDEQAEKITIILQTQEFPTWNIIYITRKFNLLNIKINAVDGKIIEEKIVPLLSFEKGNKQI